MPSQANASRIELLPDRLQPDSYKALPLCHRRYRPVNVIFTPQFAPQSYWQPVCQGEPPYPHTSRTVKFNEKTKDAGLDFSDDGVSRRADLIHR
jgi:hypothetical protein